MKKVIPALILIFAFVLTFSGCAFDGNKPALVISGTEIDKEIYAYYEDLVLQRPQDHNVANIKDDSAVRDATVQLCVRYLAVNTLFAEKQLSLSAHEKVTIAENVNNYWLRFSRHYESLGVSKQTLTKIMTSEKCEDAVFASFYDKGVDNQETERDIQAYFYSNYTAFRSICAYFTADDGSAVTEQEKYNILASFDGIIAASGEDGNAFNNACADAGYTASDIVVLGSKSDGYPNGFFNKVYTQKEKSVSKFEYDECVFAVVKEDIKELGEGVYAAYRDSCIRDMYESAWQDTMGNYMQKFTVDSVNV